MRGDSLSPRRSAGAVQGAHGRCPVSARTVCRRCSVRFDWVDASCSPAHRCFVWWRWWWFTVCGVAGPVAGVARWQWSRRHCFGCGVAIGPLRSLFCFVVTTVVARIGRLWVGDPAHPEIAAPGQPTCNAARFRQLSPLPPPSLGMEFQMCMALQKRFMKYCNA